MVGIHPGSRVPARTWGEDGFREVARQMTETFGAKIIWFADPADLSAAPKMANLVPASLSLEQFLAVLSACKFLVCNDSGPMHMSGALGVPVVAIFGSTFPDWYRPPGNLHRVVTRRDVPCRPCGDHCHTRSALLPENDHCRGGYDGSAAGCCNHFKLGGRNNMCVTDLSSLLSEFPSRNVLVVAVI